MASSLIMGKYVIAKVTGRHEARVVEDGAVFQRDGTIVDVGPAAELRAAISLTACSALSITWCCRASSTAIITWA